MADSSDQLWVLSTEGVPFTVSGVQNPECDLDMEWLPKPVEIEGGTSPISQLTSTQQCSFALDSQGAVLLYMQPSLLAIRRRINVCENQRWYPVLGWSRPLPTDRGTLSTENGDSVDVGSGQTCLPTSSWRWEDAWAMGLDRRTEKEGWEYAFNFGSSAKWRNSMGANSFVRRRFWKRYMRFMAFARWIPLSDMGLSFVCVTAGCRSITDNSCQLFAIGTDGAVYRRRGISRISPEGLGWETVSGLSQQDNDAQDNIVFLTCSPIYPTLVAGTWDGSLYYRKGINKLRPNGVSWVSLPSPNGLPVTGAAVGSRTVWITTAQGEVWMHRLELEKSRFRHDLSKITASTYTLVGTGMRQISVNEHDLVLCVSNEGSKIYFREGISEHEPAGRSFQPVIQRTGTEELKWAAVSVTGCSFSTIPMHWKNRIYRCVHKKSFKQADWRAKILSSLIEVDQRAWDVFSSKCGENDVLMRSSTAETESSTKRGRVRVRVEQNRVYLEGMIYIQKDEIKISTDKHTWQKRHDELLVVENTFDGKPFRFCVYLIFVGPIHVRLAFDSEDERDAWHSALHLVIVRSVGVSPRDRSSQSAWSVSHRGTVRQHIINELSVDEKHNVSPKPLDCVRSVCVPGHFSTVSAGVERVVWTVNNAGVPFALSPDWSPFDEQSTNDHMQSDEVEMVVQEYQRWSLLRGFVSFPTEVDGISGWMDRSGPVTGKYSRLPSRYWSWLDSEWTLKNENEDWKYSEKVHGPYTTTQNKAKFRRRVWYRRARYQRKTPWIRVEAPELKSVHVQKHEADRILVWAVTMTGDVLIRQGVTRTHPQGTAWKQILTDEPVACLAIHSPCSVFVATTTNKILRRECTSITDMECVDWYPLDGRQFSQPIREMACSWNSLWIVCGNTLMMTNIQSVDMKAVYSLESEATISTDSSGRLFISQNGRTHRMTEWILETKVVKKRKVAEYKCCSKEQLNTGITGSLSVL